MAESSSSEDDDVMMNFQFFVSVSLSLSVSCFPFRAGFLHIMAKVASSGPMFHSAGIEYLFLKSSM